MSCIYNVLCIYEIHFNSIQQQEREKMQINALAEPFRELTTYNFFTFAMASINNAPINAEWSYLQSPDISLSMLHHHPIIKQCFCATTHHFLKVLMWSDFSVPDQ